MATYEPLTTKNFARTITEAMAEERTFTMRMDADGEGFDGAVDLGDGTQFSMAGTLTENGETSEMIMLDGRVVMRDEGEKKYTELPPNMASAVLASVGDMSPAAQAEEFHELLASVKYLGPEDADEERFHRYQVAYDADAVKKRLEKESGRTLDEVPAGFPLTVEVVLDGDHRLRQMAFEAMGQKAVIDVDHWGEQVKIELPPASQIELIDVG